MERFVHPAELLDLATASGNDPRPMPRTMVVIAHPDDEVLALGGRLTRHLKTIFVHLTDGVPLDGTDCTAHGFSSLEAYRNAREEELAQAFSHAGLWTARRIQLKISDQLVTFYLQQLTARLASLLRQFTPEVILTHPYEGGHPDHDACTVAVHRAVATVGTHNPPLIIEAAFYHAGPNGIETNCFLPATGSAAVVMRVLNPEERQRKQELLSCFATQSETLRYFRDDLEQYRIAPRYDFSTPPHEGELFYEKYPWGMTGARFRALVRFTLGAEVAICS
jgi:N-acetylglucosamine malate deacetylase 2